MPLLCDTTPAASGSKSAENHDSSALSTRSATPRATVQPQITVPTPEELANESDLPEISEIFQNGKSGSRRKKKKTRKRARNTDSDTIEIGSASDNDLDQQQSSRPLKRKRVVSSATKETIEILDSSDGESDSEQLIEITRQVKVKKVIKITSIPSTWSVPRNGSKTAYLLDLRDDDRTWPKDKEGNPVSMATLIFEEVRSPSKLISVWAVSQSLTCALCRIKTRGPAGAALGQRPRLSRPWFQF
jgi:hypothetical protein